MIPRFARFLAVPSLAFSVCFAFAAPAPKPNPEVRKELDALWADLLSADELTAGRALLKFAMHPDDAVIYLQGKLHPLKLSRQRAKELLKQLGGNDAQAVRAAFGEFRYYDPRLALEDEDFREWMLDTVGGRRLGAVLCDLPMETFSFREWHWNSPDSKIYRFTHGNEIKNLDVAIAVAAIGKDGRKASWARAIRAVAIIEHIGTPECVALLQEMATGHPDAAPTKAAIAALTRLRKK